MIEVWKPVVGYKGFYEVSNRGRVRSVDRVIIRSNGWRLTTRERILRPSVAKGGYLRVYIRKITDGQSRLVHTLVLESFVGPCPKGKETRHLNGNPSDNRWPENLKYGTPKENGADTISHGMSRRGENSGRAVFKNQDIILIRKTTQAYQGKKSKIIKKLAERFGVDESAIRKIRDRKRWAHV